MNQQRSIKVREYHYSLNSIMMMMMMMMIRFFLFLKMSIYQLLTIDGLIGGLFVIVMGLFACNKIIIVSKPCYAIQHCMNSSFFLNLRIPIIVFLREWDSDTILELMITSL